MSTKMCALWNPSLWMMCGHIPTCGVVSVFPCSLFLDLISPHTVSWWEPRPQSNKAPRHDPEKQIILFPLDVCTPVEAKIKKTGSYDVFRQVGNILDFKIITENETKSLLKLIFVSFISALVIQFLILWQASFLVEITFHAFSKLKDTYGA